MQQKSLSANEMPIGKRRGGYEEGLAWSTWSRNLQTRDPVSNKVKGKKLTSKIVLGPHTHRHTCAHAHIHTQEHIHKKKIKRSEKRKGGRGEEEREGGGEGKNRKETEIMRFIDF